MTDATTEFFSGLGRRGPDPLLKKVTATVRFDLVQGERTDPYLVAIKKGDLLVSNKNAEADCVVRTDRALFDSIAGGEENAMAALLRGELTFQGDPWVLLAFQRLFPGPPGSRDRQRTTRSEGRRS